jgi:hypothetical protein
MMKCWKMNLRPGQYSWWGTNGVARRIAGNVALQIATSEWSKLQLAVLDVLRAQSRRRTCQRMGKIYPGKPLQVKSRKELIASLKPKDWQYLRADNGDLPVEYVPPVAARAVATLDS